LCGDDGGNRWGDDRPYLLPQTARAPSLQRPRLAPFPISRLFLWFRARPAHFHLVEGPHRTLKVSPPSRFFSGPPGISSSCGGAISKIDGAAATRLFVPAPAALTTRATVPRRFVFLFFHFFGATTQTDPTRSWRPSSRTSWKRTSTRRCIWPRRLA